MSQTTLKPNKIYYLDYGTAQLVGRYSHTEAEHHVFINFLYYSNGREVYQPEAQQMSQKGIKEFRLASKPEMHALFRNEIEQSA
jgi:hypothetical protein